ncbi:MAG: hypothetical protein UNLARM2_0326 [Candidatus Micrarchaeum acidiphilum ARMAN-2]|jgi:hypothetical protein|uniref:Uncharacterized protein n=1 Tax=Candidatus Micrarchaeum acidiphilum ARMAN-2 TaxID=425595 RepID=C7DGX6_MICA2|nr:MAG: hypothetical protein UNLARM2_0326 [Candidatus Micrarchaeum acidiphilum ARMAN-2]
MAKELHASESSSYSVHSSCDMVPWIPIRSVDKHLNKIALKMKDGYVLTVKSFKKDRVVSIKKVGGAFVAANFKCFYLILLILCNLITTNVVICIHTIKYISTL